MIDLSILRKDLCTLQDYLKTDLHLSRSQIKKYLPNKKLREHIVHFKERIQLPGDLLNTLEINPLYTGSPISIIYEDSCYLVIDKPSRIHSHPLNYSSRNNCLSFLRANHYYAPLNINKEYYDRGLIHRLDFETSGILILIKNKILHKKIYRNLNSFIVKKIYHAIVHGKYSHLGEHHIHLKKSSIKGKKMKVTSSNKGRLGILSIENENYDKERNISFIEISLTTGIRHQIRVTLASLGYPIVGDVLYGGERSRRLFLHCSSYHSKKYTFRSSYKDLENYFLNRDSSL